MRGTGGLRTEGTAYMLCCSIGVFVASQLYAAFIGLRALFFGVPDEMKMLAEEVRPASGLLAFTSGRFAMAVMFGTAGLAVAYAVTVSGLAKATEWVPVMSSLCRGITG